MKRTQAPGLDIAAIPLVGIAKRGEWPSSSKITTRVYDKLRSGSQRPLVCIGYTDRSLILRMNDQACALGFSANTLAKTVTSSMADFVDGGGGHAKAGAIRVKIGFTKEVMNELIRLLSG
jgi:RecJ-like exonuclease